MPPPRRPQKAGQVRPRPEGARAGRRELVLNSSAAGLLLGVPALGALPLGPFGGAAPRPPGLGVTDYGGGAKQLAFCPPTPNCISSTENPNDGEHYVPGWNFNPPDGRGGPFGTSASREQAMAELVAAVEGCDADRFKPRIVERKDDYLYAEFESRWIGYVDDVEFWFPDDRANTVEYRSSSRVGANDGKVNRKRIKAIRVALQKKGWRSNGF